MHDWTCSNEFDYFLVNSLCKTLTIIQQHVILLFKNFSFFHPLHDPPHVTITLILFQCYTGILLLIKSLPSSNPVNNILKFFPFLNKYLLGWFVQGPPVLFVGTDNNIFVVEDGHLTDVFNERRLKNRNMTDFLLWAYLYLQKLEELFYRVGSFGGKTDILGASIGIKIVCLFFNRVYRIDTPTRTHPKQYCYTSSSAYIINTIP